MVDDTEDQSTIEKYVGKTIEMARITDDVLWLTFTDNTGLTFKDEAQSCCETRYMSCDDNLQDFTGDKLVGAEIVPVKEQNDNEYGDVHEMQFLRIKLASGSVITCCTHNEHNGYYGGFSVRVSEVLK